jgi:2'-5' RNA ligase
VADRGDGARRANTFFALVPPAPVRDAVMRLRRRLDPALPDSVRAVPGRNLHITMAFLGALPSARLPGLREVAGVQPVPRTMLVLDRLGAFPRARVGWLGCHDVSPVLLRFHDTLRARLEAADFPMDERPWVPHLTLYRNLRTTLPSIDVEPLEWAVDELVLLRTRSTSQGPDYLVEGRWKATDEGDRSRSP